MACQGSVSGREAERCARCSRGNVGKRIQATFKRAVKRNHVKRQLRESYRLHKSVLFDALASHPDAKLMIAFIWMSGQIEDTEKVDGMMQRALDKVVKSLVFDEGDETIA